MKSKYLTTLSAALVLGTVIASADHHGKKKTVANMATENMQPNAKTQKTLTPDSVLAALVAGNEAYVAGQSSDPNIKARRAAGMEGQFPKAYILSCIDSRVPVEQVFSQGLGDLFVGRVAGNVENVDQLGSMEYAAAVGGVKLIMVLGHEACGAVKGACDHVELGNITALLNNIKPAIKEVPGHEGQRTSKNKQFVAEVIEKNAAMTVEDIRKGSKILADMEKEGKIKIIGGVYSLETGKVTLL